MIQVCILFALTSISIFQKHRFQHAICLCYCSDFAHFVLNAFVVMFDNQYWHTRIESIILKFDYVSVDIVNSKKIIIFFQCLSVNINLNQFFLIQIGSNSSVILTVRALFDVKIYWLSLHRHFSSFSFRRWIKVFYDRSNLFQFITK